MPISKVHVNIKKVMQVNWKKYHLIKFHRCIINLLKHSKIKRQLNTEEIFYVKIDNLRVT